jgi:hypothetical protein
MDMDLLGAKRLTAEHASGYWVIGITFDPDNIVSLDVHEDTTLTVAIEALGPNDFYFGHIFCIRHFHFSLLIPYLSRS